MNHERLDVLESQILAALSEDSSSSGKFEFVSQSTIETVIESGTSDARHRCDGYLMGEDSLSAANCPTSVDSSRHKSIRFWLKLVFCTVKTELTLMNSEQKGKLNPNKEKSTALAGLFLGTSD